MECPSSSGGLQSSTSHRPHRLLCRAAPHAPADGSPAVVTKARNAHQAGPAPKAKAKSTTTQRTRGARTHARQKRNPTARATPAPPTRTREAHKDRVHGSLRRPVSVQAQPPSPAARSGETLHRSQRPGAELRTPTQHQGSMREAQAQATRDPQPAGNVRVTNRQPFGSIPRV